MPSGEKLRREVEKEWTKFADKSFKGYRDVLTHIAYLEQRSKLTKATFSDEQKAEVILAAIPLEMKRIWTVTLGDKVKKKAELIKAIQQQAELGHSDEDFGGTSSSGFTKEKKGVKDEVAFYAGPGGIPKHKGKLAKNDGQGGHKKNCDGSGHKKQPCGRCGRNRPHDPDFECPAKHHRCEHCQKVGHYDQHWFLKKKEAQRKGQGGPGPGRFDFEKRGQERAGGAYMATEWDRRDRSHNGHYHSAPPYPDLYSKPGWSVRDEHAWMTGHTREDFPEASEGASGDTAYAYVDSCTTTNLAARKAVEGSIVSTRPVKQAIAVAKKGSQINITEEVVVR